MHRIVPSSRRAALALLAGFGIAAAAAPAAEADPVAVGSGSLTWGFKESFRNYIGGASATTVTGGVTLDDRGVATLPVDHGTFDADTGATDISYAGTIQYRSHCESGLGLPAGECALDLTFSALRVAIDRDEQTLYAHVVGRKLEPGYPMTDFGTLPVASLGIDGATVTTDGGVTAWSGVTETSTAQAAPATTYPAGTPLDQLSLSYEGPGGKPQLGESWTVPGTIGLRIAATAKGEVTQNQPSTLFLDEGQHAVHVLNSWTSADAAMPAISALSPDDLHTLGTSAPLSAFDAQASATTADPASGTVFLATYNQGLVGLRWDPAAEQYTQTALDSGGRAPIAMTWNAAAGTLDAITVSYDDGSAMLSRWTRSGAAWTRTDLPLPRPADGGDTIQSYTPGSWGNGALAALGDGSLILTRDLLLDPDGNLGDVNPAPLRLVPGADDVSVSEITGATTEHGPEIVGGEANWVVAGPNGRVVFGTRASGLGSSFVRFGRLQDGQVTVDPDPISIPTPGEEALVAAFDPSDGTVWIKGVQSGTIFGLDADGRIVAKLTAQDTARSSTIAVGADHEIYTAGRTQDVHAQTTAITRLGYSPTVTTQPEDTSVRLGSGAQEVTLTAEATGTPAPTVQWQRRDAGAARFVDVVGQTATTLTVPVTATLGGASYRAVFTNSSGQLASAAATITVQTAPGIAVQPADVDVAAGQNAVLQVMPTGNPDPVVTWQRRIDGAWQDIATGDPRLTPTGGTLTIVGAGVEQSGTAFRARLTNSVDTTYSRVVTLTVRGATTTGGGGGSSSAAATPEPAPAPVTTPTAPAAQQSPSTASTPTVQRPRIAPHVARQRVGAAGTATVATVACGTTSCRVAAPRTVRVRIAGRTYTARVLVGRATGAGRVTVRLRLPRPAVRALVGRRIQVGVRLTVTAAGAQASRTATLTLSGAAPAKR